ncbi:hypothetical protein EAF00_003889 [Botryotinia globosa]|nr:hypothetical protein EAF00_003889 [Botryotinia globosa]
MKPISKLVSKRPITVPATAYICTFCSAQAIPRTRKYSSTPASSASSLSASTKISIQPQSQVQSGFHTLAKKGITRLSTRRLISLRGPDSMKYLQGVITNDIYKEGLNSDKKGFYSAFLNAKGRVLNDVWIYKDLYADRGKYGEKGKEGENWLIEVDAKEVEVLAKHIKRYRMRAKFDVDVVSEEEMGIYSCWGVEDGVGTREGTGIMVADHRAPEMGKRIVANKGWDLQRDLEGVDEELKIQEEEIYRVRRYLIGVPEGQDEILRESALPQESNMDVMGGIDYGKGCYVGQELTIRTHHTGVIRKRIIPMMLVPDGETLPGLGELGYKGGNLASYLRGSENIKKVGVKRPVGKWLSGVGNVGLGLARLDEMGKWMMEGHGKEGDAGEEFVVEAKDEEEGDARNIRVRAFPPAWIET